MTIYNLTSIIKIDINKGVEYSLIKYRPEEISFYGLFRTKPGFYYHIKRINSYCYSKEELEKKGYNGYQLFVKDNKVFVKPNVVITFFDGHREIEWFASDILAEYFGIMVADNGIEKYQQLKME